MKLTYYKHPEGNFGDDLNEWLWSRLLPGVMDDDSSVLFIGMGTALGRFFTDQLPPNSLRVVFGTGGGKDRRFPLLDSSWHVYGVRGPLTAAFFGLDQTKILTDPAMAIRDFPELKKSKRKGVGFMPHYFSVQEWDWHALCSDAGVVYIDPHTPSIETLHQIAGLEKLVSEAMHGAIVADALRIPWIGVSISPRFDHGKWHDWGGSLGMPVFIHPLQPLYRPRSAVESSKNLIKQQFLSRVSSRFTPAQARSTQRDVELAKQKLMFISRNYDPQLSEDANLEKALSRFNDALENFRRDFDAGRYKGIEKK